MKTISFQHDVLPLKNQLFRLALRITLDRAEAEDIVQDTLLKVWEKHGEWEKIDSIEAYSLAICRRLSIDKTRRAGRRNISLSADNPPPEPLSHQPDPHEETVRSDKVNIVRCIIDSLPEAQRSCIQLRDIEGKTYKDIADILSMTEEKVKVNIFRGRQKIKEQFNQKEQYGL